MLMFIPNQQMVALDILLQEEALEMEVDSPMTSQSFGLLNDLAVLLHAVANCQQNPESLDLAYYAWDDGICKNPRTGKNPF